MSTSVRLPKTLGELRRSRKFAEEHIRKRSVKDEIRENLIALLKKGRPIFPGIIGFDDTVTPQIVNTLLSRHNFILLGGRRPWNNDKLSVHKLALDLRARTYPGAKVETLENAQRPLAVQLIRKALDHDGDGRIFTPERESARIVLYGLSFGGAAVAKLA